MVRCRRTHWTGIYIHDVLLQDGLRHVAVLKKCALHLLSVVYYMRHNTAFMHLFSLLSVRFSIDIQVA